MEKKIKSLKTLLLSFFILGLLFSNIVVATSSEVFPLGWGPGSFVTDGNKQIPIEHTLSAGSTILSDRMGKVYGYITGVNWRPDGAKFLLKNPSGEVVYSVEAKAEIQQVSGLPSIPDWWLIFPITWPWAFSPKGFIYTIDFMDIEVPAFPARGNWKLELVIYDSAFKLVEGTSLVATWSFNVGESSLWDNLFAPIYLTYGGVLGGVGAFSVPLPCLFLLTAPIWGYIAFLAIVRLWTGSFSMGGQELKKGFDIVRSKIGVRKHGKTKKSKK